MANIQISQLPTAQPLTGSELVPVVQNGVTVQTTAGSISSTPNQQQTFLTLNQETSLPNSRRLSSGTGVSFNDGGPLSALTVNLTGAPSSLISSGNGIQVKLNSSTLTARSIEVGSGLSIDNPDGLSGNPKISYSGLMSNIASQSGTGLLAISGTSATPVTIAGTANQVSVTNGNGVGSPTIGLADNAILPGTGAMTIPQGTSVQRPTGSQGQFRFNTDTQTFDGYAAGLWRTFTLAGGVTTFSAGATGFTPNTDTSGAVTLGGTLLPNSGGTGASGSLTGYVYGNGSAAMTASPTIPTTNLSGTVTNAQLANSAITINGSSVSLGGSTTVTATASNALTIGTGLTGTSYNGSTPVTVAIDSTVVTLTGTQNLTNKTLTSPIVKNNFKFEAAGIAAYTQFTSALGSWIFNANNFQEVYLLNQNNGSDASADYVIYNDASDVNSYFIDMGMNSSNYTSVTYPVFTPNSGYLYTGGGLTGQASDLFVGTSNAASDVIFFTGDVLTSNIRGRFKGNTGNFLLGTATDTGQMLQVQGTTKFTGASSFGSTVALSADPTLALQAATKQYVDSAVSTGFVVHTPVRLATTAALPANTYNNGASGVGATLTAVATGVLTINGSTANLNDRVLIKNEVASANNGVYTVTVAGAIGVAYVLTRVTDFDVVGAGEIANNAYFFVTAGGSNAGASFVLSQLAAITVGTTALPFTEFASQLVYTGGTNIDVTGQVISLTGTVAATNGGTGTATVTTGDLLYGSGTNTWSKLALGSAYKSLMVNAAGTQVEWNAVPLNQTTAVSGQLNVNNGGTGASTLSGLAFGNGTSAFTAATAAQIVSAIGATAVQNATNTTITANLTNATNYLTFVSSTSGNLPQLVQSGITVNPSTASITGGIKGGAF